MSGHKKQSRKSSDREEAVRETAEERLFHRSALRSGPGKLLSAPEDVYLPLFVAQTQLSRSLLAQRKDTRTDCLSAEDSNTHSSSRFCSSSSRKQPVTDDDEVNEVLRLPDSVVVNHPSSDIIDQIIKKRCQKHKEALKQLEQDLIQVSQVCEEQVKTASQELLSSHQDMDLRLDTLKVRIGHLEHSSLQEVHALWEEVQEEVKLKTTRISELNVRLNECEGQRTNELRAALRNHCQRLEEISFLPSPDVHKLIYDKAMMLNEALLANRCGIARLIVRLKEENLQKELALREHWEHNLTCWKSSKVDAVVERFSSLVPPTCSSALVSDWFEQLTAVNQQIDHLHAKLLHQLRCRVEGSWHDQLQELEHCKEALSTLELSDEQVNDIISSQLLPVTGQRQSQDEERLAALEVCSKSVAQHTLSVSRCVFVVVQVAAELWETHSKRLKSREEELQQHLDDIKHKQQQHIERKKMFVDVLVTKLRQESSEENLKMTLDKTVPYLQNIEHSSRECVSDQRGVLDHLSALFKEELDSYTCSLNSFFHLSKACNPGHRGLLELSQLSLGKRQWYTLDRSPGNISCRNCDQIQTCVSPQSPGELQRSQSCSSIISTLVPDGASETLNLKETTEKQLISCQNEGDLSQNSEEWQTEVQSSLLMLSDIGTNVIITSSRGEIYTGPTFRCPAPDVQQQTQLSSLPVELITSTLSRFRTLILEHLGDLHISNFNLLNPDAGMIKDWMEAVQSEQELQLQQLNLEHIQTHIYQPRLAELQLHQQRVAVHCEELSNTLISCRTELQDLQNSISRKNQEFFVSLSKIEDNVKEACTSRGLEAVNTALQDCVDGHIKDTQHCQAIFRHTVQTRLEEARHRTTVFLNSFRLFSEGGDFSPEEVAMFQKRLKKETKQILVTEMSIYSELETFECQNLKQVKEASAGLQQKLTSCRSELDFAEQLQKVIRSTKLQIKVEAASSSQQQSVINSRLDDLKRMMENPKVPPDQVCSFFSSVNEDIKRRCEYLEFKLDVVLLKTVASSVCPKPPRQGYLENPSVDMIRSFNRLMMFQDSPAKHQQTGGTTAGRSDLEVKQKRTKSKALSSFSSLVDSVLWTTKNIVLQVAKDFYHFRHPNSLRMVPNTLDQWTETMMQSLLGIHEQAQRFLSTSRDDLVKQLLVFEELLKSLPAVLISNHGQQHEICLRETVGGARSKLEETLAASNKEKNENYRQLRVSLSEDELHKLDSREELRQQQLHTAICCTYLEVQECVRIRGEKFVTSLAALTERLLHQLDDLLPPAEIETPVTHQDTEDNMETGDETGSEPSRGRSTWSGISYLLLPTDKTADPQSSVTMATTSSIITTNYSRKHEAVIEHRDAAVKHFEQLLRSELSCSDDVKQRQLSEQLCWNTHWRREIQTLRGIHRKHLHPCGP